MRRYKVIAISLTILGGMTIVMCAYDFASEEILPLVTGGHPNELDPNCSSVNASIAPLFG